MPSDTTRPHSRRALLAGAFGAAAAAAAAAFGRPAAALAGTDGDVVLGALNTADTTTRINYNGSGTAFRTASTSGIGVHGDSLKNTGVVGTSSTGNGVTGTSSYYGVYGESTQMYGVYGYTDQGRAGVVGFSSVGHGVRGASDSGNAVFGFNYGDQASVLGESLANATGVAGMSMRGDRNDLKTPLSTGVYGWAEGDAFTRGVYGHTTGGRGVFGEASSGTGVRGNSTAGGIGVHGDSPSGLGVAGNSGSQTGVLGTSVSMTGLQGFAGSGKPPAPKGLTGVYGHSPNGRGAQLAGGVAQLRLVPSTSATYPASGLLGDFFLDKSGRLWFCKGGATWKQVSVV
jgi:hypothetical protein